MSKRPTTAEHNGWKRHYLKMARSAVRRRDWLAASQFYCRAAFHDQVVRTVKTKGQ